MDDLFGLIQYKIFADYRNLKAFTTTKQTLRTPKPRFTGDSATIFEDNRKHLSVCLGISPKQLVFPRQTHTNRVVEVLEIPLAEIVETDALVTNQHGICLCVQTADCVPILLFDPAKNIISAIHAGWRGTTNKIVEVAIKKMCSAYGSLPENILAAIGPSISPRVYEVGDEVVAAAKLSLPHSEAALHQRPSGKFHFNLWEANRQLLIACGVGSQNIETLSECTFTENHKYFSARKEGIETGRLVSGIMLEA